METWSSEFSDEDLLKAAPQVLATLMNTEGDPRHGDWQPEELGEILQHQLDAPLLFDLGSVDGGSREPADGDNDAAEVRSFGALFNHPNPPLGLLRLTKDFAKMSDRRVANPLPAEVATVLYYAAIAAAVLRHEQWISRIGQQKFNDGVAWVLRQQWVVGSLRDLFLEFQTTRHLEENQHNDR